MKVLMVGPDRSVMGGISTVVNQYYEAGLDRDVELTYLPSTIDGNKAVKALSFFKACGKFLKTVKEQDIVHIHMATKGSYVRKRLFVRIAKLRGKRTIIHIHAGPFDEFYKRSCSLLQRDIRTTLSLADYVIVLAENLKDKLAGIRSDDRVVVLHNAIRVPAPRIADYSDHNTLFLGLVTERKGVYDLLRAWKGVLGVLPDAMLYVGGNGEVDKARSFCEEMGIADHVRFVGWVTGKDKEQLFETCSVFVLPSHTEAMPMCILEAMGHGLATVATTVGGIPSMIDDEREGILLPCGKPKELQRTLCFLLQDENRKRELGQSGYARVRRAFNLDLEKEKLLALYKTLLDQNGECR